MVIRSGYLEFYRDEEKSEMDKIFRPHNFLQLISPLARSREAMESPVPFVIPTWVSSRLFLWSVTFLCQSNRRVEWRMERSVLC